jgi:ATP-dependent exoDNAse (exonuclease V) beta subunit
MHKNGKYPSVTQVLGVLRKIGLEMWFKQNTSEFCDAESKRGKEVGTIIHSIIQGSIEKEQVTFETEYDQEVMFCLKGFAKFKKEHPEFRLKKAEVEVISEKHGFMGHIDCVATEKNELIIFDWKSSKCDVGKVGKNGVSKEKDIPPIYPEHEFQVSAYVMAYNEQMKTKITRAQILCVAKDKDTYSLMSLNGNAIRERFEEVFLPALKICNYQLKNK